MRRFFLMILLLIAWNRTDAQTYTLAFDTTDYQELFDDTILSSDGWVAKHYPLLLPFPIRTGNVSASQIYVNTDGRIRRLSGTGASATFRTMIWAWGNCGLRQNSNEMSQISHKTEGDSPFRIVKIQFKNAGFVGDESNLEKLNFQIWLHEDGKRIEIVYGPCSANSQLALNGAYGPFVGLGTQYIRGLPSAPILGTIDYGLSGMPQNGFTYRFARP